MTMIAVLALVGVVLRRFCVGKWATRIAITLLLVLGFLPIGKDMLVSLENRYAPPTELPHKIDGILVLGGSINTKESIVHNQVQLNQNAGRITEMMSLVKRYPKARIVFTGGDGNLVPSSSSESEQLNILLKNIGFNTSRIVFEGKSRNTFENMEFSKAMVHPKMGENWVLVTSAFHMPRSAAIFNSNGWNVVPYPAGYVTDGRYEFLPSFDVLGNMYKFQVAAKEYIGIMAYTLTGRIQSDGTETLTPDFFVRDSGVVPPQSRAGD